MTPPERRPGRRLRAGERALRAALEDAAEQARGVAGTESWRFRSVAELLLELGQWYRAGQPVESVTTFGGVFTEARGRRLSYVEGVVLTKAGEVKEAVWAAVDDQVVVGPVARAYLGVPITESLRETTRKRFGVASALHTRGRDGWRLLKYGIPQP